MFISSFEHMFILIVFIYFSRINLVVIGLDSETEKRNVSYHYECGISTQTNSNYTLGSSKAAVGAWPWVAVRSIVMLNSS